jgi:hypothetical protein
MTENEHRLVVQMFIQQARMMSTLVAILESRGILENSDLLAYDAHQVADEAHVSELEREVKKMYQEFAEVSGVTTGLPPAV